MIFFLSMRSIRKTHISRNMMYIFQIAMENLKEQSYYNLIRFISSISSCTLPKYGHLKNRKFLIFCSMIRSNSKFGQDMAVWKWRPKILDFEPNIFFKPWYKSLECSHGISIIGNKNHPNHLKFIDQIF